MLNKFILTLLMSFLVIAPVIADENSTTVYYFHSSQRCRTCNKMEKFTKEAVSELNNVEFKPVNTDEPDNKHYLLDYRLYTKSVIVTDDRGNWKNLDKIWSLAKNEKKFKEYIKSEIAQFESKQK